MTISGGSILLSNNLSTCGCAFSPDFTFTSMNNYGAWGSGSVDLDNAGDEVLLLDDRDTVLDAVAWGSGSLSRRDPHTAAGGEHLLERLAQDVDTNNCAIDFAAIVIGPCPPSRRWSSSPPSRRGRSRGWCAWHGRR